MYTDRTSLNRCPPQIDKLPTTFVLPMNGFVLIEREKKD